MWKKRPEDGGEGLEPRVGKGFGECSLCITQGEMTGAKKVPFRQSLFHKYVFCFLSGVLKGTELQSRF